MDRFLHALQTGGKSEEEDAHAGHDDHEEEAHAHDDHEEEAHADLGFGERVVARIRRFRGFVDEFDRGGVYLGVPGTVEVRGGRGVRFRARGRGARRGDEEPVQVVHDAESGFGGGGVRREHVRVDDSDGF